MLGLARRVGCFAVRWCSDSDFACCLDDAVLRFLQLFVCMVLSLAVFRGTHFHLAELPTGLKTVTLLSFQLFLADFFTLIMVSHPILGHQPSVTTPATQV